MRFDNRRKIANRIHTPFGFVVKNESNIRSTSLEFMPYRNLLSHMSACRDRDRVYGTMVTRRLRAMGIREKPTAAASP